MLGIDPGTAVVGYGVVRAAHRTPQLVECGVIRTRASEPLANRLATIFDGISEIVDRHRPSSIAIEGLFHGKNARSALVLGHGRGVILLAASRAGVPILEISPAEVKRAVTGTGAATKPQVGAMVMRLLCLSAVPQPADAADGVAIALTCAMRLRSPVDRIRSAR